MRKMRFVLLALIALAVPIIIMLFIMFPLSISKGDMEREFEENRTDIMFVTEYLANSGYDSVYIPDFDESGMIFTGLDSGDVPVDSVEVTTAIDRLINKLGYEVICRNGNVIYFQRWSNKDNGRGVVYSIDGHVPDESDLDFLTELSPLIDTDWYYYEEDFNLWKMNHTK